MYTDPNQQAESGGVLENNHQQIDQNKNQTTEQPTQPEISNVSSETKIAEQPWHPSHGF